MFYMKNMSELSSAIRAVCEEKDLSYESVVETIELSLAAAYRKDCGQKNQNIKVEFNSETGQTKIVDVKVVVEDLPEDWEEKRAMKLEENKEGVDSKEENVSASSPQSDSGQAVQGKKESAQCGQGKKKDDKEEVKKEIVESEVGEEEEERKFNPKTEIQLCDAKLVKKSAKIDDEIITELPAPDGYGRMAAQTAKQVIIQKLREAEREMIFKEFKDKEKEVVTGVVQRQEGRNILVDLGKAVGRLPAEEQIMGERYNPGEKIKVYIKEIRSGNKGPEIVLSRISEEILKKIFYLEIPEISNGLLEIKAVAREAGSRSKVAIWTDSENVDPIGSCVGQRGSRIQTIISELGGERVDMVEYNEEPAKFIANALSPAKVLSVDVDEEERSAIVKVLVDQLSLAIGKKGQNVRLAAKLTGWKIDIMEEGDGTSAKLMEEDDDVKEEIKEEKEEIKEEKESSSTKKKVDEGKENKKVDEKEAKKAEKEKEKEAKKATKKAEKEAKKAEKEKAKEAKKAEKEKVASASSAQVKK